MPDEQENLTLLPVVQPHELETLEFTGWRNKDGTVETPFGEQWKGWPNAIFVVGSNDRRYRFRCIDTDNRSDAETDEQGRRQSMAWYVNE